MANNRSLHDYPFDFKPETWPLNDMFLGVADRLQFQFNKSLYKWKWGLELEFGLETLEGFTASHVPEINPDYDANKLSYPQASPALDMHKRLTETASTPSPSFEKAERIIRYIQETETLGAYMKAVGQTKRSMIAAIRGFQKNLTHKETPVSEHAIENILLAHLHILPARMGGLRDIIIPRFGSYLLGVGWWDADNTAEVRLPPTTGHRKFIRDFHHIMDIIHKTAEEHRLIPVMDQSTPQVHHSIWEWRGEDKENPYVNQSAMEDELSMVGAEYHLRGLYAIMAEAPHLINDMDFQDLSGSIQLDTSYLRGYAIRQTGYSNELRRGFNGNYIHLARDVALIMAGSAYGLLHATSMKDARDERETNFIAYQGSQFKDLLKRRVDPFWDLMCRARLTNMGAWLRVGTDSNIQNEIFGGNVEEGKFPARRFIVSPDDVRDVLPRLLESLGEENIDKFKVTFEGKEYNLRSDITWVHMVATIGVDEETNKLITDHLPEELQDFFEPLRYQGAFNYFRGEEFATHFGTGTLQRKLGDLRESKVLKKVLTQDEITQIGDFYTEHLAIRMQQLAKKVVREMAYMYRMVGADKEARNKFDIHYLFGTVAEAAIDEEINIEKIEGAKEEAISSTNLGIEELRARNNTIKMLRPHYRQAVEDALQKQREIGNFDNQFAAHLHDSADFLDRDIWNLDTRRQVVFNNVLSAMIALPTIIRDNGKNGRSPEALKKRLEEIIFLDMDVRTRLALSDAHNSREDVIRFVEHEREAVFDQLKKMEEGTFESYRRIRIKDFKQVTRHIFFDDLDEDEKALFLEDEVKAFSILREMLGEEYDQIVADIRAIPQTKPALEPVP